MTTTSFGRTAADVRRWPEDPIARAALERYFAAFPVEPGTGIPMLAGSGLDFTGADLSGLLLVDAELDGANLGGVRLADANLAGARLWGANLSRADLTHSWLRKAEGRNCLARDAVFAGADFLRVNFEEADLRGADLRRARFDNAWLWRADLRGADLRDCVFGGDRTWTGLDEARLAECRVEGASGWVSGPADVGEDTPRLLAGAGLARWFAERGAPEVEAAETP